MVTEDEFLKKIVEYLNDTQNAELRHEIELLIKESADYKKVYDQIIFVWNKSSDLHKLEQLDCGKAVSQIELKLAEMESAQSTPYHGNVFNIKKWIAVAAVLLIGIIGYWSFNQTMQPKFLVKVTQGKIDSIVLVDGSKIYLDSFSVIKYPEIFKGTTRQISLVKGEAFFKIHRDTLHPFVVNIGVSSVKVLGTSFNIDSRNKSIALNVATGLVKFQPRADREDGAILHAGTGIIYYRNEQRLDILQSVNKNNHAWLTHELDFVDASLTEVCKQIEAYYKVKIVLSGNTAAFKKLNANFKESKLAEVLEVLQDTYPIKIKHLDNNSIVIQSITK